MHPFYVRFVCSPQFRVKPRKQKVQSPPAIPKQAIPPTPSWRREAPHSTRSHVRGVEGRTGSCFAGWRWVSPRPFRRWGNRCFRFFTYTLRHRRAEAEVKFLPILADLGTTTQEFQIGMGLMATPGVVKGLFEAHRALASMPMPRIAGPAVSLARRRARLKRFQAYIPGVVEKFTWATGSAAPFSVAPTGTIRRWARGASCACPRLPTTSRRWQPGPRASVRRGEVVRRIAKDGRTGGGLLTMEGLARYSIECRRALTISALGARRHTNPASSSGGILIAPP